MTRLIHKLANTLHGLRAISRFDNPVHCLCQRVLGRKIGWTVYSKGRLRFLVDHSAGDQNGTRDCIASPMYRELFEHMNLPEEIRVLDLGANGGGFPLLCLDLGYRLAALTCVEVNPFTFARLTLNITHNVGLRPTLMNAAIGGRPRELTLAFPAGGTGVSIFSASARAKESALIRVLTLDDIVQRGFGTDPVDVCKMDVEGAEYETLLEGPVETMTRIHYLIIEIHASDAAATDALSKRIINLGFGHVATSRYCRDVHLFANRLWKGSTIH